MGSWIFKRAHEPVMLEPSLHRGPRNPECWPVKLPIFLSQNLILDRDFIELFIINISQCICHSGAGDELCETELSKAGE